MIALAKYVAFARIAAVQAIGERGDLYGRMLFFVVILGVFRTLWQAVSEAGMPIPAEAWQLVWYLAATEWILISPPGVYTDVEADVRRGDVACQLVRPYAYLAALAAQGAGALVVRAPVLAATAFGCAFALTGRVPPLHAFVYVLPFGLWAMLVIHALYVITGLLAFWLHDVSPVFWVWQKVLFILGGLMLPLALYPEWLQRVASFTPFPWLLASPASFVLGGGREEAIALVLALAGWSAVIVVSTHLLFSRAIRRLEVNGG